MLLRLLYLTLTSMFTLIRLLPRKRPGRPRTVGSIRALVHPSTAWVTQLTRNMAMDLKEEVEVVRTGVQMPRMNAIMERWVRSCRTELLDRTLIWSQTHLLHALREYEGFYNELSPHRTLASAAPLPLPEPITAPDQLTHLHVHRRDRLGGLLHEYRHASWEHEGSPSLPARKRLRPLPRATATPCDGLRSGQQIVDMAEQDPTAAIHEIQQIRKAAEAEAGL
ncbi:integrase core domain-containing protein [Streptomyces sp. DASNCL29]|uniref:integrase core domain-containing protein n=1 Tax=Streptomyces sp. DASNCL29 TaxID=2583819 RepID=UPI003211E699